MRAGVCMWRISFWLFFSIGYIIINNSIKAGFNHYRPNRLHFLPYFNPRSPCGERPKKIVIGDGTRNFNPRSPCGERPGHGGVVLRPFAISIHAPRAGSDIIPDAPSLHTRFISIHAPRAGSDYVYNQLQKRHYHFNPRSPCGERRQLRPHAARPGLYFNPHSPCGERQ